MIYINCPICDAPLESVGSYYGGDKCEKGHYYVDCGNYHTSIIVNGKEVAYFGDCSSTAENELQLKNLSEAVGEARREWLTRQ